MRSALPFSQTTPPGKAEPPSLRYGERGIALVITLILLSVITFMAVSFLVLSRGQKGSVSTQQDQTTARLTADAAYEHAISLLLAPTMAWTNGYSFDLLVSTNFLNPFFATGGNGYGNPTNVSFNYANGRPISGKDALQNLMNELYDPRPPVYVTNRQAGGMEFRYYLDLNRNGLFEPTGVLPVVGQNGQLFRDTNGFATSNYLVGDPQWIGMLERPAFPSGAARRPSSALGSPHSPTNKFISRYSFEVIPASQTLDINHIYNLARSVSGVTPPYDFFRNQGVGSWEINLAALLRDLNTNLWGYNYQGLSPNRFASSGTAFDDARNLVLYRHRDFSNPGRSVAALYGKLGTDEVRANHIDVYSAGPPMGLSAPAFYLNPVKTHFFGAPSTNHLFTIQDYFDPNRTSSLFTNRLVSAGTNVSSYDRYTYYRLLSTLGSDSAPEPDQINLNYVNVDNAGRVVPEMATNFISWSTNPTRFFTNVANKLLTNFFGNTNISVSYIPIYPNNFYTPSVHRLLQVAANIYDATTYSATRARFSTNAIQMPSVFRPLFEQREINGTNVIFISGYEELTNTTFVTAPPRMHDLSNTNDLTKIGRRDMFYGIPLVIGAKKGLPNFNEFAMQTRIEVVRKLEFRRRGNSADSPIFRTNQMYVVGISNVFGVEGWNSYSNAYPHRLRMIAAVDVHATLTNEVPGQYPLYHPPGVYPPFGFFTNYGVSMNLQPNAWRGFPAAANTRARLSFQIPLQTNFFALPDSVYKQSVRKFVPLVGVGLFENPSHFPVPHWWLNLNNRLRFILIDVDANRIVDYVNLSAWENTLDITDTLMREGHCDNPYVPDGSDGSLWCTNRLAGSTSEDAPTFGILNQMQVGLGNLQPLDWNSFARMSPPGLDRNQAIDFFRAQFGLSPLHYQGTVFNKSNIFYAPFNPKRDVYVHTSWEANDPLVHYTIGDLMDLVRTNNIDFHGEGSKIPNLGQINDRYEPWGGNPLAKTTSPTKYQLAIKDPLVTRSDDWDFPTNKFPSIGWLGRVHRGTPWQTIYLKSPLIDLATWAKWTGNGVVMTNYGQVATNIPALSDVLALSITNATQPSTNFLRLGYIYADASFTHPLYDRYLLDLFTTTFNDNAARGRMSINQTNLAAWSAILSGVIAVTNTASENDLFKNPFLTAQYEPVVIDPAGVYDPSARIAPAIVKILRAINDVRATNILTQPRKTFDRLGEILAVPELTVASPFLNTAATNQTVLKRGLNDAVYERIPQQILGLLKADPVPRFVIYAYGQTLKPAERSLYLGSGPFFGLCTNYQVTAEAATRTVVRIEGVPIHPTPLAVPPALTNLHAVIEQFNVLPPD